MKRYRAGTFGWLAVAILASVGAVNGAARENVAGRVVNPPPSSTRDLENDTVVSLKRVYFGSAQSVLSSDEKTALRHMADRFRARPETIFELRGYSDGTEQDPALCFLRAETIASFLSTNGIPWDNIRVMGLGRVDDSAAAEHRRVDVRVFAPSASDPRLAQPDAPEISAYRY